MYKAPSDAAILQNFENAKEVYASMGIDVEKAIERFEKRPDLVSNKELIEYNDLNISSLTSWSSILINVLFTEYYNIIRAYIVIIR